MDAIGGALCAWFACVVAGGLVLMGIHAAAHAAYFRHVHDDLPHCGACGYNVHGVSSHACPECGADLLVAGLRIRGLSPPMGMGSRTAIWTMLLPGPALAGLLAIFLLPGLHEWDGVAWAREGEYHYDIPAAGGHSAMGQRVVRSVKLAGGPRQSALGELLGNDQLRVGPASVDPIPRDELRLKLAAVRRDVPAQDVAMIHEALTAILAGQDPPSSWSWTHRTYARPPAWLIPSYGIAAVALWIFGITLLERQHAKDQAAHLLAMEKIMATLEAGMRKIDAP